MISLCTCCSKNVLYFLWLEIFRGKYEINFYENKLRLKFRKKRTRILIYTSFILVVLMSFLHRKHFDLACWSICLYWFSKKTFLALQLMLMRHFLSILFSFLLLWDVSMQVTYSKGPLLSKNNAMITMDCFVLRGRQSNELLSFPWPDQREKFRLRLLNFAHDYREGNLDYKELFVLVKLSLTSEEKCIFSRDLL